MSDIEARLHYSFRDTDLLERALTHRSLGGAHNQRLEFLGDSVLGLAIAELLYHLHPTEPEGDLSRRLVSLVNGEQLSLIAEGWELGDEIYMSESEEEQGGRTNASNLEDAVEALLGAIYLDGGMEAIKQVVARFWRPLAEGMASPPKDPKTALQEWVQAKGLPLPEYALISMEGPSHAPHFVIEVRVVGQASMRAEAGTKKLAERMAAQALFVTLAP